MASDHGAGSFGMGGLLYFNLRTTTDMGHERPISYSSYASRLAFQWRGVVWRYDGDLFEAFYLGIYSDFQCVKEVGGFLYFLGFVLRANCLCFFSG